MDAKSKTYAYLQFVFFIEPKCSVLFDKNGIPKHQKDLKQPEADVAEMFSPSADIRKEEKADDTARSRSSTLLNTREHYEGLVQNYCNYLILYNKFQ